MFAVQDVSQWVAERPETVGSKEKQWLLPTPVGSARPHLFKIGRPNTGEDWSEKVACEIAKLLDLPCAHYEFATFAGQPGVISEKFFPANASFHPANTLLSRIDDEYDGSKRFKQVRYKLFPSIAIIKGLRFRPPLEPITRLPEMATEHIFVGYLMLDALIGNTDRHHENWGAVLSVEGRVHLAPTFDHASSLGREQTDERRKERLSTRDQRITVAAYADRARSAFYGPGRDAKVMTSKEVIEVLNLAHPTATKFWADKMSEIPANEFESIFANVPPKIVSDVSAEFAVQLLAHNQGMIREVVYGR